MAVSVRIDSTGARCTELGPSVYDLCLSEEGALTLGYQVNGKRRSKASFQNLGAMSAWLRAKGVYDIDVDALNLKLYYDGAGNVLNLDDTSKAAYYIAPSCSHSDFELCGRSGAAWTLLDVGTFSMCKDCLWRRISAKGTSFHAKKARYLEYHTALGEVTKNTSAATYVFEQFSDNRWVLCRRESNTWVRITDGNKKKCMMSMQSHVQQYLLAQAAAEATTVKRTRRAPHRISEECYDGNKRLVGKVPTPETRYSIRLMSHKRYRIVCRESDVGQFHLLTDREFDNEDQAYAYFMLLVGAASLEFMDAKQQVVDFEEAVYCKRHLDDGTVEIHKNDGNAWERITSGEEDAMEEWHTPESETFFDDILAPCSGEQALYKEYVAQPGVLHQLYKKTASGWKSIRRGSPSDITQYKSMLHDTAMQALEARKSQPAVETSGREDVPEFVSKPSQATTSLVAQRTPIEESLWKDIKDTTWLFKESVADHILTLAQRNRYIGVSPVFDTRLYDSANQPIYIADMDFDKREQKHNRIRLQQLRIFKALHEVQAVCPSVRELPLPIQMAHDPSNYLWDPTSRILPITLHTMEHILEDNNNRLPEVFAGASRTALMEFLRNEILIGEARALRDPFFALPCYSARDDSVSMLLPVHSPLLSERNKVVAALILGKGARGYTVKTLLDGAQAVRSVSLFCDPRNTWLKECYEDVRRSLDAEV